MARAAAWKSRTLMPWSEGFSRYRRANTAAGRSSPSRRAAMPNTARAPSASAADWNTSNAYAPGAMRKNGTRRYMIGEKWSPHACISGRLT